jgi:hypothetical protein
LLGGTQDICDMAKAVRRSLTEDELTILGYICDLYGDQNTTEDVFFSDQDEAVIFVKDKVGTMGLCVVLTNVAEWSKRDRLSRDQICKQYLLIS